MERRHIAVATMALFCAMLATTSAHARHHKNTQDNKQSTITQFCGDRVCGVVSSDRPASRSRSAGHHRGHRAAPRDGNGNSVSTAGLVGPLLSKVNEIRADCGSIVVSAYRPGARIPTGRISNHALHRAADLKGNPSCIYAHLRGWPGGYSTDYASAPGGPHVHISYNPGGMEWGVRFAHHHGGGWPRTVHRGHRHRVASR